MPHTVLVSEQLFALVNAIWPTYDSFLISINADRDDHIALLRSIRPVTSEKLFGPSYLPR